MARIESGKIVTVTSMKGGVGKTISLLLLVAVLKKIKKKALIIDLDLYNGDIAFSLNLEVKRTIYNLCDDITNNRYKSDTFNEYVVKYNEYIDILPSPKDPRQASKLDVKSLETILRSFTSKYDLVLIDTNHILDVTNMIAFENSDIILNVFGNDAFDLKSTKTFISICKNIGVENLILVLNESIDERKKYFSLYEIETIIKEKINYYIPKSFYIKNIDKHIMDGKLLETFEKLLKKDTEDTVNLTNLVLRLLNNNKGVNRHEEK